jgi:hypothetical protein
MALIRPVVLVFEELATPTVTPTTPDLNCLVVGPAYFIQDYFQPGTTTPADKASIQLGASYGQLEAPIGTPTPIGPGVIVVPDAPNDVVGAILDPASVRLWFDDARVIIASGAAGATSTTAPNQFTQSDGSVDFTAGPSRVVPGDRLLVSDGTNTIARTVFSVDSSTQLHFTQDIPSSSFTPGSNESWRVERELNDQLVAAGPGAYLSISGNQIAINGGISLSVPTQGQKPVSFAKVFIAYRSLRQDLQQLDTVTSQADMSAKIGRLDARNPLAVGCFVALQNTTTRVQFFGVASNDLAGHAMVRDAVASRPDVYAIVPLIADPSVIAMWNADSIGRAQPDEVRGRPQRFRAVIGSGTLPIFDTLVQPRASGQTVAANGTAPSPPLLTRLTAPGIDFVATNVQPSDKVTVSLDAATPPRNGTYTVAQVLDATNLEIDPSTPLPAAVTGNASIEVVGPSGSPVRIAAAAVTGLVSAAKGDLILQLSDPNGTFVSSGVIPGDLLQFPADPSTNAFAGPLTQFLIAQVLSENRLLVKNNGPDTAIAQNELPRGVERASGAVVPATATLNYQIVRKLSKDQQVTHLVAQAQSFSSRRCVLVWPDICDVAGVIGGKGQPGYYLACAVGGMTAGLPSHQGFTFLGIAGVSQIYDSNTYFDDTQVTDISDGGWYVFAQQTPESLPFTIHQLTTDVSTLQTGEFSVVKNFDFVALFFINILEEFLHGYNLTQEALTLIRAALNIGGDTLKLRTFAKIGAPLTSFSIVDLGISPLAADRAVARLAVGLPVPLNVLELHLAA